MLEPMDAELIEVSRWEEVPEFTSETEEADFWATHCLGDELLVQMQPISNDILPPSRIETLKSQLQTILDALPENLLAEVKDFAEFLQQKQQKAAS